MSNKVIVASVAGIAGISILGAVQQKHGISKILAGAYIVLLLLSLLDLFGGVWSQLASGLAILALVSSIVLNKTLFPSLAQVSGSYTPGTLPIVPATPPRAT